MNKKEWFFTDESALSDWTVCKKGSSKWNMFMGLPVVQKDGFIRLNCQIDGCSFITSGLQSKELLGSGSVEVKARFKGGKSSWPAIWLIDERNATRYYEIDICEYFGDNNKVKSGLFMPKHMSSVFRRWFRPKKNTKIKKGDWNIFRCEWNEKSIKIFVNGKLVINYKNNGSDKSYPQTEEDRKYNLFLTMQYAYGKPRPSQLPLWMDVEYVKYEPA